MNYLHPEGELNINTFVMRVVHTFLLSIFRATAVLCIYSIRVQSRYTVVLKQALWSFRTKYHHRDIEDRGH